MATLRNVIINELEQNKNLELRTIDGTIILIYSHNMVYKTQGIMWIQYL